MNLSLFIRSAGLKLNIERCIWQSW